ncbi:MAG: hypothetical protein D6679_01800 [Candidatus Hydrogenedentota bacterium]|nr:MAG: hypothetical protein D6679_01800 [Candidatus Hydrogenedentota bacterium]
MKITFLLSRGPRLWSPSDLWLRSAVAAARRFAPSGAILLVQAHPGRNRFAGWMYEEAGGKCLWIGADIERRPSKRELFEWDHLRCREADLLVVLDIRPGGNMERCLEEAVSLGKRIVCPRENSAAASFLEERFPGRCEIMDLRIEIPRISPPPLPPLRRPEGEFLWHYTRSCPGPWPGQRTEEYFRSLVENHPLSGHTAGDTLARIWNEGRLRAGGGLIRGGVPVVCFSEASPEEISELHRYRPALLRWDFEPFAIGIPIALAKSLGARKVQHRSPEEWKRLQPEQRWLYQKFLPGSSDYRAEREWRIRGDVVLTEIEEKLAVFHPGE